MKNIIELLIPSVYAADTCNAQDSQYDSCCLARSGELDALNVQLIQLSLQYADVEGPHDDLTALQNQINTADMEYRIQCASVNTNLQPTTSESCQQKYGDFFVRKGEDGFADLCYCDDKTTDAVENVNCLSIPPESFQKDCADRGGIYKGGVCDVCAFGLATDGTCVANTQGTLGIECSDPTKPCSLNTSQLFRSTGVASGTESKSLLVRFQDMTLAATGFIGTVLTISLIVVALRYITGGVDQSYIGNAKKAFKYAIIGFFLVVFSYTIIRLVQFLAKGG